MGLKIDGKWLGKHHSNQLENDFWKWMEKQGISQWDLDTGERKGHITIFWNEDED